MLRENILLQLCAVLSLIGIVGILICSFTPWMNFDREVEYPNATRLCMTVIMLGLLRGAF